MLLLFLLSCSMWRNPISLRYILIIFSIKTVVVIYDHLWSWSMQSSIYFDVNAYLFFTFISLKVYFFPPLVTNHMHSFLLFFPSLHFKQYFHIFIQDFLFCRCTDWSEICYYLVKKVVNMQIYSGKIKFPVTFSTFKRKLPFFCP